METWGVVLTVLALMPLFLQRGMNRPALVGVAVALWVLCFVLADVSGWRAVFHGSVTLFPVAVVWWTCRPAVDPVCASTG